MCRRKYDKRQLTRIVRTADEGVVVDPTGKRNGRGAYLCDQAECWDKIENDVRPLSTALEVEISDKEIAAIAARRLLIDGTV